MNVIIKAIYYHNLELKINASPCYPKTSVSPHIPVLILACAFDARLQYPPESAAYPSCILQVYLLKKGLRIVMAANLSRYSNSFGQHRICLAKSVSTPTLTSGPWLLLLHALPATWSSISPEQNGFISTYSCNPSIITVTTLTKKHSCYSTGFQPGPSPY